MAQNKLALGAIVMAACNVVKIALQIVLTPTLAHLLGPENFGLYSLAQPSVMFVMMLADAGLGQSLAREPEEHVEVWSSAFWVLLGLGLFLALAVSLWSLPLSLLAHQSRLPMIMAPLSICVVLMTLTVPPNARLTRRGRIEAFSLIDVLANFVGVWSLVGQFLTLYTVRAVAANLMAFHRPRLVFSWRAVLPHTLLGGSIVITKFIDSFGRMLESTVLSRRFGSAGLGVYAFSNQAAWSLVQAVNNPTGTMIYVHAINAPDPEGVKALYRRLVRVTAMVTLPATAIIAAVAPLLADQLLGKAWLSGALLITMVFPSQAIGTLGQLAGSVLYAQGRARSQAWLTLIYSSLRIGAVVVPFGGWPAVAIYIGSVNAAYFVMGLVNTRLQLGWSLSTTLTVVRGPIAASVIAGVATYFLSPLAPKGLVGLFAVMCAGGVLFCLVLAALDFALLREDWTELRRLIGRREAPAAQGA